MSSGINMAKGFDGDDELGAPIGGSYTDAVPGSTVATSATGVTITAKGKSHQLPFVYGKTVQDYLNGIPRSERPGTGFFSRTTVMIDGKKANKNDMLSAGAVVTITRNTMNGQR